MTTVIEALIQVAAQEDAIAYRKLRALPAMVDLCKPTTIDAIVSEYDPAPSGYYNCFFTATIKNDVRIFQKAAELHDQLVEDLKNFIADGDFTTECLFQPLPTVLGQKSKEFGGNVMGVTDLQHDGVIFTAIAIVKTKDQEAFAYPKLKAWGNAVCDYARTIENGLLDWIYMNYADKSQNPLASYGPENVKKLKDAAAKYDPEQVFQKLCPGGFKISKA
uniref:Putative 6-hydroxy-D-nicotine oxidase n=1 Tax=Cladonia uncialis subsp. uncialis TaxID=180999 RepID=A0A1Z1C4D3_CLAUC|nr:putative 6-hydroxy-D-nicotine oxidase [Cladonia uncialis subsp. uncialis]